jgi:hypothetical protein
MPFDNLLVNEFIHKFYGFGNLQAKYWFIGMEEGGGTSRAEFEYRINAWVKLGKKTLVDVVKYHEIIGINRFFVDPVKLQSTWNKLIRIYLSSQDLQTNTDDVRLFQKTQLGRIDQNTSLLELLPLASPSTNQWLYSSWVDYPLLKSREIYREGTVPFRIKSLQWLIEENQPTVVVFYGQSNEEYWGKVVSAPLKFEKTLDIKYAKGKGTLFVSIKHPVYKGLTNVYFHQIGRWIHNHI